MVDGDGQIERYKAWLVAQGFTQQRGDDYDGTFSPVVRMESLRTVIGLAVSNGLNLHQLDVTGFSQWKVRGCSVYATAGRICG